MEHAAAKQRLLVFIVAFNAETTIENVLRRIPESLNHDYDTEILVIDDSSGDATVTMARRAASKGDLPFRITVLRNPENQGYGGNQKVGFQYAIQRNFDFVALLHGDGQYAPELLTELLKPLAAGQADAVFGSRMMERFGAIKGGMPLYKFIGNRILTGFQNRLLKMNLSEFHSGYRIYRVSALRHIPFHLNANVFHFDTEIIIQLLFAGFRIKELPIPTYYGDEICYVNGLRYASDVISTTLKASFQSLGIFYDRKFDCAQRDVTNNRHYAPKLHIVSPQLLATTVIHDKGRVLDIGCCGGQLATTLARRGCTVTGVDRFPPEEEAALDQFIQADLNDNAIPVDVQNYDYILLLDVIEHLLRPEEFIEKLKIACSFKPDVTIIASSGNVAFFITRVMLLLGQFNYGKRGILDLTHTRLFTFRSFRRLFEQAGFQIEHVQGVPAPFAFAFGDTLFSRLLLAFNSLLLQISTSLFAYQIFMIVKPMRSLPLLLRDAELSAAPAPRTDDKDDRS